jgi:hypothetical protein
MGWKRVDLGDFQKLALGILPDLELCLQFLAEN